LPDLAQLVVGHGSGRRPAKEKNKREKKEGKIYIYNKIIKKLKEKDLRILPNVFLS